MCYEVYTCYNIGIAKKFILVLENRTNVCYDNFIATGVLCGNRGVHNMDYKELIIKLLEKINNERVLRHIYVLLKEFVDGE